MPCKIIKFCSWFKWKILNFFAITQSNSATFKQKRKKNLLNLCHDKYVRHLTTLNLLRRYYLVDHTIRIFVFNNFTFLLQTKTLCFSHALIIYQISKKFVRQTNNCNIFYNKKTKLPKSKTIFLNAIIEAFLGNYENSILKTTFLYVYALPNEKNESDRKT